MENLFAWTSCLSHSLSLYVKVSCSKTLWHVDKRNRQWTTCSTSWLSSLVTYKENHILFCIDNSTSENSTSIQILNWSNYWSTNIELSTSPNYPLLSLKRWQLKVRISFKTSHGDQHTVNGSLEKGWKGFQWDEENWETDLEVDSVASWQTHK